MKYKTKQEEFWAGSFGDSYIGRNESPRWVAANTGLFGKILSGSVGVRSIIELGCNIGLNLEALHAINPSFALSGVEINASACEVARAKDIGTIHAGSIIEPLDVPKADLCFTKGVLIHINPDHLREVYNNLYELSNRYVLVVEYYNPQPVTINYRGHDDRLFKRDFAGELMDEFGLKLVDYGFAYHRDKWFPQDDVTWFLMEK